MVWLGRDVGGNVGPTALRDVASRVDRGVDYACGGLGLGEDTKGENGGGSDPPSSDPAEVG